MKSFMYSFAFCAVLLSACYKGHGLDPEFQESALTGISGRVTFTGAWPDSTRGVYVAAVKTFPAGMHDPDSLLTYAFNAFAAGNLVFSDTIPRNTVQYDFRMLLTPGIWDWVLVVWFPDIENYFFGIKEIGAYYFGADPADPAPVQIIPGALTENIDIAADFAHVNRDAPFFKARRIWKR